MHIQQMLFKSVLLHKGHGCGVYWHCHEDTAGNEDISHALPQMQGHELK